MIRTTSARYQNYFWYKHLFIFGLIFLVSSLFFNSPYEIFLGYKRILTSHGLLLSDYMAIGNVGATLFNAGILTLMGLGILYFSKTYITGVVIAGVINLAAFAMLGKNPYNILAPIIGVYIYSLYMKESFYMYAPISLFATGVAPVVSYMTFYSGFPILQGAILGNLSGFVTGFIIAAVSVNAKNLHRGYCLYNIGFSLGMTSSVMYSVYNLFGVEVVSENALYREFNLKLIVFIGLFCIVLILLKLIYDRNNLAEFKDMLKETGQSPAEFPDKYSNYTILFNMGIVGLIGLIYLVLIKANVNGVTLGGVFTMVAFGAFGLHPKNALPILTGVFIAGTLGIYDVNAESIAIAALFGTSLAPVAGDYGFFAGIVTAFIHLGLVTKIGFLHGGMNLYNNGFSSGIIAAVVVPFFESIRLNNLKRAHKHNK